MPGKHQQLFQAVDCPLLLSICWKLLHWSNVQCPLTRPVVVLATVWYYHLMLVLEILHQTGSAAHQQLPLKRGDDPTARAKVAWYVIVKPLAPLLPNIP